MKDEIVKLAVEGILIRAEILRAKLEEANIPCIVSEDSAYGNLLGIRISVFKKDYDSAKKIYEEVYNNFSQELDVEITDEEIFEK